MGDGQQLTWLPYKKNLNLGLIEVLDRTTCLQSDQNSKLNKIVKKDADIKLPFLRNRTFFGVILSQKVLYILLLLL